jgi:hypothetical protein
VTPRTSLNPAGQVLLVEGSGFTPLEHFLVLQCHVLEAPPPPPASPNEARVPIAFGDIPLPGDYDGDGETDVAVFRPSTGTWFVNGGTAVAWGTSGDVPLPLPAAIQRAFFPWRSVAAPG